MRQFDIIKISSIDQKPNIVLEIYNGYVILANIYDGGELNVYYLKSTAIDYFGYEIYKDEIPTKIKAIEYAMKGDISQKILRDELEYNIKACKSYIDANKKLSDMISPISFGIVW